MVRFHIQQHNSILYLLHHEIRPAINIGLHSLHLLTNLERINCKIAIGFHPEEIFFLRLKMIRNTFIHTIPCVIHFCVGAHQNNKQYLTVYKSITNACCQMKRKTQK